ncbi:NlpC/P60 family protein [Kaistia adipata]|uniref:C40 family peptidase n=1 Tax=Kaistia adipata TaxID=166954 RepID=UPI00041631A0|nr:NlpC/P60 family protein [Kaistia adipata]
MTLDPRLNAFRPDLADARLAGQVQAARFVAGERQRIVAPVAAVRHAPRADAAIDSEVLLGETVRVFEATAEGWCWVQLEADGYVGFVAAEAVGPLDGEPMHQVTALRTFVYPAADMKLPPIATLSFGSRLALGDKAETRGTLYFQLADRSGAVVARHVAPLDAPPQADFVAVAERFLETPYLWGGRSAFGIDCSGLVQLSLATAGIPVPRDTDQQERAIGTSVADGIKGKLRRGDLLFWKGHVGILCDAATLLHASGYHMAVVSEPLSEALDRYGRSGLDVTAVRRP